MSLQNSAPGRIAPRGQIDPRGQRFAAALTAVVLAAVLISQNPWLLLFQVLIFASGVFFGPSRSPYALLFRAVVRPRLGPPKELEDARPPRFAQGVGLVFGIAGVLAFFFGAALVGSIATGFALIAALLNATIGLCLGCELYLILRRLSPARS